MKHARSDALDQLEPLLAQIRQRQGLKEKKRGTFYRKTQAFLHFHEDPAGLFADIRSAPDQDFCRFPVSTQSQQQTLLEALDRALGG